jgi:hypothetical protein
MATVVVLLLVIVYQGVTHMVERKRLLKVNDDLLNRLMSRDFTSYAAGQAVCQPAVRRSLDEFFKESKSQEEKENEREALGMPVT